MVRRLELPFPQSPSKSYSPLQLIVLISFYPGPISHKNKRIVINHSAHLHYLFMIDISLQLIYLLLQHIRPDISKKLPLQLLIRRCFHSSSRELANISLKLSLTPVASLALFFLSIPLLQLMLSYSKMFLCFENKIEESFFFLTPKGLLTRIDPPSGSHRRLFDIFLKSRPALITWLGLSDIGCTIIYFFQGFQPIEKQFCGHI